MVNRVFDDEGRAFYKRTVAADGRQRAKTDAQNEVNQASEYCYSSLRVMFLRWCPVARNRRCSLSLLDFSRSDVVCKAACNDRHFLFSHRFVTSGMHHMLLLSR